MNPFEANRRPSQLKVRCVNAAVDPCWTTISGAAPPVTCANTVEAKRSAAARTASFGRFLARLGNLRQEAELSKMFRGVWKLTEPGWCSTKENRRFNNGPKKNWPPANFLPRDFSTQLLRTADSHGERASSSEQPVKSCSDTASLMIANARAERRGSLPYYAD